MQLIKNQDLMSFALLTDLNFRSIKFTIHDMTPYELRPYVNCANVGALLDCARIGTRTMKFTIHDMTPRELRFLGGIKLRFEQVRSWNVTVRKPRDCKRPSFGFHPAFPQK